VRVAEVSRTTVDDDDDDDDNCRFVKRITQDASTALLNGSLVWSAVGLDVVIGL